MKKQGKKMGYMYLRILLMAVGLLCLCTLLAAPNVHAGEFVTIKDAKFKQQLLSLGSYERVGLMVGKWPDYVALHERRDYCSHPDEIYYYRKDGDFYLVNHRFQFKGSYSEKTGDFIDIYQHSKDMEFIAKKSVKLPFKYMGGFYEGEDGYFYLAVGDRGPDIRTTARIIKYTQEWEEVGYVNIPVDMVHVYPGCWLAFHSGNCRMAMKGKYLIIHTVRQMDSCHQGNISWIIDTNTMKLLNKTEGGSSYVSHSFNQFVKYDKQTDTFSFLDHGDAYPRSLTLVQVSAERQLGTYDGIKNIKNNFCESGEYIKFPGTTGANFTGCEVSGFETGKSNNLAVGVSLPQNYEIQGVTGNKAKKYNLYMLLINKKNPKSFRIKWLTRDNPETSPIDIKEPRLVKLSETRFALLYSIEDERHGNPAMCYRLYDSTGNQLASRNYYNTFFSGNSQPLFTGDSLIWASPKTNDPLDEKVFLYEMPYIDKEVEIAEFESEQISIPQGESVSPAFQYNGPAKIIKWASSDEKVAVVKHGTITAEGPGIADISAKAGEKEGTCTVTVRPEQAEILKLSAGKRSLQVTWVMQENVTGYQAIAAQNSSFTKGEKALTVRRDKVKGTTIKGLKSGKHYYVRLRAYKESQGRTLYGAYSRTKKVKVK